MNRLLSLTFAITAFLAISSCSPEDIIDTTGNLIGEVCDSRNGQTLSGVSVALSPTGVTYTTGTDGRYEFRNIQSQNYTVSVKKEGYQEDKKTIFVPAGQDANLDFQITPLTGNLKLSQTTMDFGNDASTLAFDIENVGEAALVWELSEDASWITCSPTSGTISKGEKTSVIVKVDRKGLERGNYSQTIAVSSNGGSGIISVNMAVQGLMVKVSPEELDFGSTTSSLELNLINNGSGSISYTLIASNEWIKLSHTTGNFTKTENITVSVDRSVLSEGNHSGNLVLTIGEENITIPVRMNIPSKEKPTVTLQLIDQITFSSAYLKGAIASIGSQRVIKHGFCWDTIEEPTISSQGVCNLGDSEKAKDFSYTPTSLSSNTIYYVRAYAENTEGISYSNQLKFQTKGTPQLPSVETGIISSIESNQANASGNIISLGNTEEISQFGHVWGIKSAPTILGNKTELGITSNTGGFNSTLTDLTPNTQYYVRAYAINSVGTSYGEEVVFTTQYADAVVETNSINNITHNAATCYGNITSTGGHSVYERGFCWNTLSNPSLSNNSIVSTSSTNDFAANLTGLAENTTYHVRAYIKTSEGNIFYGNDIAFSTKTKDIKIEKAGYGEDNNWTR